MIKLLLPLVLLFTSLNCFGVTSYFDPNSSRQRIKEYRPAAEQGEAEAQFKLGAAYEQGVGYRVLTDSEKESKTMRAFHKVGVGFFSSISDVPQDYTEAAKWYFKAAEQGHTSAQSKIGAMYKHGIGVPQDYTEAAKWFRRAAEQGDCEAQYALGRMYDTGEGVPKDNTEAGKWYSRAAEQGSEAASWMITMTELGELAEVLVEHSKGEGVPEDDTEADKWYLKAAKRGNAKAQYSVGLMYANGDRVPEDNVVAYMWWNLAAAQGHEDAKKNMGVVSEDMTKEQIAEAQKMSREWLAKPSK